MRLKDKVAIVTGAASGINRATAFAMAKEGASVVVADINRDGARRVAEDIKKSGGRALVIKTDISNNDEVKQMVEKAIAEFGRLDILVNGASFLDLSYKPFHETDVAEWKSEIDVTFLGTLLCCRAAVPHMLKQKSGRIISVTSDSGKMGLPPGVSLYAACKAAISGFSKTIARELATEGITVNCVSPGLIKTPPLVSTLTKYPGMEQSLTAPIPMRRIGEPEDIAHMVVFLASDEAKYITGQDYSVDGGVWM